MAVACVVIYLDSLMPVPQNAAIQSVTGDSVPGQYFTEESGWVHGPYNSTLS